MVPDDAATDGYYGEVDGSKDEIDLSFLDDDDEEDEPTSAGPTPPPSA